MNFTDIVTVAGTRRTGDGYLVADARIARTGIQSYSGVEIGRPEMHAVRIYRPGAEVFSDDTLKSAAHRPVTNEHPPEMVTSEKSYDDSRISGCIGHQSRGRHCWPFGRYLTRPLQAPIYGTGDRRITNLWSVGGDLFDGAGTFLSASYQLAFAPGECRRHERYGFCGGGVCHVDCRLGFRRYFPMGQRWE